MRIIDIRLLYDEISKTKLPIGGVQDASEVGGEFRATFVPYFSQFLQFSWSAEPSAGYEKVLASIISSHFGMQVGEDKLIELKGKFPEPWQPSEIVKPEDAAFTFTTAISVNIKPHLAAYINSGCKISDLVQDSYGLPYERLHGGCEKARKLLEEQIAIEPVITNMPAEGVSLWNGMTVQTGLIFEWLSVAALRFGVDAGLDIVNGYLLEPFEKGIMVTGIDGFVINESIKLLPNLRLVTLDEIRNYLDYERLCGPRIISYAPRRFPSAALIVDYTHPKFTHSGKAVKQAYELNKRDIINLLTLFGPSAPSAVISFEPSTPQPFSLKNASFGGIGFSNDPSFYHTPFAPDLSGFSVAYERFNELEGKNKKRVEISLTRLNKALRQKNVTNKALELGIALESILLSGKDDDGSSGEITFRLASRGAWLLGTNPKERSHIFNILKSAYKLRSKAAHEGDIPSVTKGVFKGEPPMPTTYLLQDASKLCAQAIHKVILNREVPNWTNLVLGG